jgi:hypothetical protein
MTEILVAGAGIDPTGATDSLAAIQDLETSASAGGILIFPSGTFMLGGSLTKKSGVSWKGSSRYASHIKSAPVIFPTAMIVGDSLNSFDINDLAFDTSDMLLVNGQTLYAPTISLNNSLWFNLRNIHMTGIKSFGIELIGCSVIEIEGCGFMKPSASPLMNEAIWLRSCNVAKILTNKFQNTAISVESDAFVISHNYMAGWGYGSGITTDHSGISTLGIITDNICVGGTGIDQNNVHPMGIENWATRTLIDNNICAFNSGDGLDCLTGNGCVVGNNILYGNSGSNAVVWRT